MPIYEYRCECGALLESLERVGETRACCGDLCVAKSGSLPRGQGQLTRVFSATGIRGDGHEAKEQVFDPVKRANRPGCDCETDG